MGVASYFGVIDIGNSGIKASLVETSTRRLFGSVRTLHFRFPNDHLKTPPMEFQSPEARWATIDDTQAFDRLLQDLTSSLPIQERPFFWQLSSVQPHALSVLLTSISKQANETAYRIVDFRDIPMPCEVDAAERVGIDRLLAAWGAWQSSTKTKPLIVIQAGTAVTVDWVSKQGIYGGGAIMPGLSLTLKYLALGTAHLPWLAPPNNLDDVPLPGKNTRDAILAGVTAGFIGGIQRLQARYRQQYQGDPNDIETVVSGGDGSILSHTIAGPFKLVDHLVLNALAQLEFH